ncbi:MAG: hypothetical protein OHK006_17850 [Thermodesulfovibrionales bacterium]
MIEGEMKKQKTVARDIARLRAMLEGNDPRTDIGPYCNDPYECDFKAHCWQHIPEDSVFKLAGKGADRFALYRQNIIRMSEIDISRLNTKQKFQVEMFLGKRSHFDRTAIREFLETLRYPLCFLDFETFESPIPPYEGTRPSCFEARVHAQGQAARPPGTACVPEDRQTEGHDYREFEKAYSCHGRLRPPERGHPDRVPARAGRGKR